MKKPALLSLFCILLFFSLNLFSQELTWKQYTVNDGLVQSQVNQIFQDSRGFLWIGTRAGVSRFDGIHFENFTERDGLLGQWIADIAEDSEHNIWFKSNLGFSRYDGDTIVNFPFDSTLTHTQNYGFRFQAVTRDSVLIYTLLYSGNVRVTCLSGGKYSIIKEYNTGVNKIGFRNDFLFVSDPLSNQIFISTDNKTLYSIKSGILKKINLSFQNIQGLHLGADNVIYLIDNGYLFCLQNEHLKQLSFSPFEDIDKHYYYKIASDKIGNIIIGTINQRIAHILMAPHYRSLPIKTPLIAPMIFDNEDNLWLGSETGLFKTSTISILNYLPEKGGMHENIWSVTQSKNGHIYFSSYHDGLQRLENEKFHQETGLPRLPNGKWVNLAMGSISDEEGNIYFTTNQSGIIGFDGTTFTTYPHSREPAGSFIIRQNKKNGGILVGANRFLFSYDKNMKITRLPVNPGNGKSINVTGLETDKLDRVWLGGFNGMSLLVGDSIIHLPTKEFPFEYGGNTLLRDHKDNLWIGNSKGLFFYNYQTFEKIKHPLLDDFILSIIEIGDSTLFIGSIKTIYMLDLKSFYTKKSLDVIAIGKDKGFEGIEPGQNGFYQDSQGFLWLPCTDRVVKIDPGMIKINTVPPRVYITDVQLLGENMSWKKVEHKVKDSLRFHLSDNEKDVRFDFIGISLRHPEGVTYSSMLEGYDKGWSEPTYESSVVYTNLPPGEYRFLVKAANTDGVWSTNQAMLSFTIVPALYQRLWFRIMVIFILAALFFAIGAYVMHLKRKKQQLTLENEHKISELRLLAIQNQIEPHFTYNALNTIAAAVLKEEKIIAYNYFVKLSHLMRTILQNNSQLITTLEDEITFVTNFVQIQQFRFTDKFDFSIQVDPEVNQQTIIPKMCIQTFVENAIKHGLLPKKEKGRLSIHVFNEGDYLCIQVEDNGIGQEKARILKTNGSTNGLKIMKGYFDHFNLLNTKKLEWQMMDLTSFDQQSNGTAVSVRIPRGFVYSKE